jgi:hypothetical protein
VFRDHLEAVVLGRFQDLDHGGEDRVANGLPVFCGLSLDQVDTCEWHKVAPLVDSDGRVLISAYACILAITCAYADNGRQGPERPNTK